MSWQDVASSAAIEHLKWALTPDIGPILFGRIVGHFGAAQAALGAGYHQLQHVEGIGPNTAEQIVHGPDPAMLQREVELAAERRVRILCAQDDDYPAGLRHITDPPIVLYVRGQLDPTDAVALGIVGARRCSTYGREQAHRFGYQLASHGLTVVSGLARGIDGEAHKGALAAGGRTLAVLGNGLAEVYPPEHAELADRICERGALISELPMTTSPNASNFLPRNRLIAGLSLGVLVIEAARRSGSLTTARLASEYDREVFALPGRIDQESSFGTNRLIRDQHAKLVLSVEDILAELGEVGETLGAPGAPPPGPTASNAAPPAGLSEEEQSILNALSDEACGIQTIAERTQLPASKVAATLIGLQLRGLARQMPGNMFVRVRR